MTDTPMTWTVEPWCFDGLFGIYWSTFTQQCLGSSMKPFTKVNYPATGFPWDVQYGANQIWNLIKNGSIKAGDTVMGFSLGSQTVMLFLSQHAREIPDGIKFLLCGCTFWRNQDFLDHGNAALYGTGGVPWDIKNQVTMIARQGDGFSDQPDILNAPGYALAKQMATAGQNVLHDYRTAKLDHLANVVTKRGNITALLVPTIKLPGVSEGMRQAIDAAYSRPSPTPDQLAVAVDVQVSQ
jgi:hypothetical protein